MGLAAGTAFGVQAMLIYMVIYVVMNVGTFAFILTMERDGRPITDIDSLQNYSDREPTRALAMLVLLFSLAGVPPLVGFFAKYYVLLAAYQGGLAWLAIAGVIAAVINAFYYLRIVYFMYFGEDREPLDRSDSPLQWGLLVGGRAHHGRGRRQPLRDRGPGGPGGGLACRVSRGPAGPRASIASCSTRPTAPTPRR